MELLGTKAFLESPSLNSKGQVQIVVDQEGRDAKTREEQSRNSSTALGPGSWFPLKGYP